MSLLKEEKAQVSFEYLLTAVFGITIAATVAIIIETLRQVAMESYVDLLNTRTEVIENIIR